MTYTASDREQWTRRLRDAAIEATCAGVDEDTLHDVVLEGVAEGRRLLALRNPTTETVPAPRRPSPYPRQDDAQPGSALANLLNATRRI